MTPDAYQTVIAAAGFFAAFGVLLGIAGVVALIDIRRELRHLRRSVRGITHRRRRDES